MNQEQREQYIQELKDLPTAELHHEIISAELTRLTNIVSTVTILYHDRRNREAIARFPNGIYSESFEGFNMSSASEKCDKITPKPPIDELRHASKCLSVRKFQLKLDQQRVLIHLKEEIDSIKQACPTYFTERNMNILVEDLKTYISETATGMFHRDNSQSRRKLMKLTKKTDETTISREAIVDCIDTNLRDIFDNPSQHHVESEKGILALVRKLGEYFAPRQRQLTNSSSSRLAMPGTELKISRRA